MKDMQTLIFDMDDTLVIEKASAEAALRATCRFANEKVGANQDNLYNRIRESCRSFWHKSPVRYFCLDVGISSWEGLWASFDGDNKNLRILADWAPSYRRNSWQEALRRCGHEGNEMFAEELGDRYIRERRKLHVVFDDVVSALEQLKRRHTLGLLTNGAPDLQRQKLEGSGLADYFDAVIVSGEVGFGKPDTRIFQVILDRLSATPSSSVMIGNSIKSDIVPALELGMRAIWINRDGKMFEEPVIPSEQIDNLMQLVEIFEPIAKCDTVNRVP